MSVNTTNKVKVNDSTETKTFYRDVTIKWASVEPGLISVMIGTHSSGALGVAHVRVSL